MRVMRVRHIPFLKYRNNDTLILSSSSNIRQVNRIAHTGVRCNVFKVVKESIGVYIGFARFRFPKFLIEFLGIFLTDLLLGVGIVYLVYM